MITTYCQSAQINRDGPFGDRFWYWNGKSGRRYIHSVFRPEECPFLPGAIYLGVRKHGGDLREVLVMGQFAPELPEWAGYLPAELADNPEIDEIDVHLLAETPQDVARAMADLAAILFPRAQRRATAAGCEAQSAWGRWFPSLRGMLHAF